MNMLQHFWKDIRAGENVDLYVTIFTSTTLVVITLLGIEIAQSYTLPLILATLTLIVVNTLGTRRRLETLTEKISSKNSDVVFCESFSESDENQLTARMDRAHEVLIISKSADITFHKNFSSLAELVMRGGTLKVVLLDPNGNGCQLFGKNDYPPTTAEAEKHKILASIIRIQSIKSKNKGNQIRVIDYPLGFGGIFVDPERSDAFFFVWHESYEIPRTHQPKMIIQPSNGKWYELYRDQAKAVWDSAYPYQEIKT